jgi:hypothetical protein
MKSARAVIGALLLAVVLATVAAPVAASADEAECASTYLATSGRELFPIEQRYLPPPLRAFPADCASRVESRQFDAGNGAFIEYDLLYVDITFDEFVAIVRSFENAGWFDTIVMSIDAETLTLDADGLAGLPDAPTSAGARFSNGSTGTDIIALDYGEGPGIDPSLAAPSLLVSIQARSAYTATGFVDPSVLSSLRSMFDLVLTGPQVAVVAGSAVMLMLVVGYPGSLLGSVISARYDDVAARMRRRGPPRKRRTPPRWLVWPGFALAAVIGGFVDPAFGFNPMSLRLLLSGLLGFLVFNLAVWTLVKAVMRRVQPDGKPYIKFRWGSLVIVLIAVVVARLLEFQPGVIFGLVSGLAFGLTLAASRDALVILLGSGFGLVAAALGWVGYSLLAPAAPGNPLLVFLTEFFSGVTIEGISSLPLALLPLAALDGAALLKWKKWVWGIAYAVGLAAFMLVLLNVPGSFGEVKGDFARWIAIFLAFAVVAIAVWAIDNYLSVRGKRRKAAEVP